MGQECIDRIADRSIDVIDHASDHADDVANNRGEDIREEFRKGALRIRCLNSSYFSGHKSLQDGGWFLGGCAKATRDELLQDVCQTCRRRLSHGPKLGGQRRDQEESGDPQSTNEMRQ